MKKLVTLIFLALIVFVPFTSFSQNQPTRDPLSHAYYQFDGAWLPDMEPSKIGPNNFKTLQNFRPTDGGIEGVQGYSKKTSTAVTYYPEFVNGFYFGKDQPQESHVLVSGITTISAGTGATNMRAVYRFDTPIPNQGDFSGIIPIHTAVTGAGIGRFSSAPGGHVAYADGKQSMIWGGDEMRVAAFFTTQSAVTDVITQGKEYTEQVNNKIDSSEEVAVIAGGNDEFTKSLLHFDGIDASTTFTDSNIDVAGPELDSAQKKFGTAAGYFNGGSTIYAADSVDWVLDNGDGSGATKFTIDLWVRLSGATDYYGIFNQQEGALDLFHAYIGPTTLNFVNIVNNLGISLTASWDPEPNIWYHLAFIRGWGGTLNDFAITIDGQAVHASTDSDSMANFEVPLHIGEARVAGVTEYMRGWIDEFRWTKGKARWTSNFNPPARPYSAAFNNWIIATTRPISGASFYLSDVNQLSGQTVTVKEWNNSSWSTLILSGNTEGTQGLTRSGKVSWRTTVDTSKPKFLQGRLFYWYQFNLSDGEATISHVTVDAPWQPIRDLWDDVYRTAIAFQVSRSGVYEDYTLEVNEESSSVFPIGATVGGLQSTDHTILMFDDRMQAIKFDIITGNTSQINAGVSFYYHDGDSYISVSNQIDLTASGSTPLNSSGVMTWSPPSESVEVSQSLFGVEGYAYKIVWNGLLGLASDPDSVVIDLAYGIPAPITVKPFKFPVSYKNRLFLCGFTQGNEGNRCDYSMTNAPDVWNGEETSMDGFQSLYFGGNEELTAAAQLHNRYGNNIFTTLVALKKTETFVLRGNAASGDDAFQILPVSSNIGTPAPLTLASAELGYEVIEGQLKRNILIWLSYSGPVYFEGSLPIPLKGIDKYFDPAESESINLDYISVSRGWYDPTYHEYNLLIPSGVGQTVNNKWFVYDLIRRKWFEKTMNGAPMPQSAWQVTDTNGAKYIYSGLTNGHIVQLESGTSLDGIPINYVIETGDFYASNDPWHETTLRAIKFANKVTSESTLAGVTHYANGATTGTTLEPIALDYGSNSTQRHTRSKPDLTGWTHRLKWSAKMSAEVKGFPPLGWGYDAFITRKDYEYGGSE